MPSSIALFELVELQITALLELLEPTCLDQKPSDSGMPTGKGPGALITGAGALPVMLAIVKNAKGILKRWKYKVERQGRAMAVVMDKYCRSCASKITVTVHRMTSWSSLLNTPTKQHHSPFVSTL